LRLMEEPVRFKSPHRWSLVLFLGWVALLFAQTPAPAKSGSSESQVPVFKANGRAVEVDVVVTRENGEPVTALHKDDFKVMEDGKAQAIDFFEEHKVRTLPPGAIPPLPRMPPNVYTNVPPVPLNDAVNVLLLDSLNTDVQDQVYVHRQIMDLLTTMEPGTQTAIFMLGSKLRFVQGFTADAGVLAAALNDKKNQPEKELLLRTRDDAMDDAFAINAMSANFGGRGSSEGVAAVTAANADYARIQHTNRSAMTLEALNHLARYLGSVPGRKNLIWFSSSFPVDVFPNISEKADIQNSEIGMSNVKQTADMLTLSKVAVYPIGAQGMMNEHVIDADSAGPGGSPLGPGHGSGIPMGAYTSEAAGRSRIIANMEQIAADTGGKAYFNTNDLNTAVKRAIDDGSHYYTIAYTPTHNKMDGSYRRIEVQVTAKGRYKTAYRRGYNADDTSRAAAMPAVDPLRPLLIHGLPSYTQLLYGVRVIPTSPQPPANAKRAGKNAELAGPTTRYSVDFMIRWQDVKLDSTPQGTHSGNIQVGLQAYNREGKAVNWTEATLGMNLSPEVFASIQKSGIPAHFEIDLPNTDVFLDTGVYDWGSGKAGTLEIPLRVGSDTASAVQPEAPKTN
jgi:VWFA-related protein